MTTPWKNADQLMTRRHLLQAGGMFLITAAMTGCDSDSTQDGGPATAPSGGIDAKEAPMLAEQVQAGTLPPLPERLPEKPLVVEPIDRLGAYGGEWNTAIRSPSDSAWLYRTIGYDELERWGWRTDVTSTESNVAESVEAAAEGREHIIHLRPGLKWSDGEPYTADDIMFAYDDVLRNTELTPALPTWLTPGGEPATFEKVDDYTVRVRFAEPQGLFRGYLGLAEGRPLVLHPRHYLERFHINYNPDANSLAEQEGYSNWVELFGAKGVITYPGDWQNGELPTLGPWQLVQAFGEGQRLAAERNPYYWKVDPEGRQLPYIDRVVFEVIDDPEVMLLRATDGGFDMHTRHIVSLANKPVLASGRDRGEYDFFEIVSSSPNYLVIALNLVHNDPVKREIFSNKEFRIGLSHAINRAEMTTVSYAGQGQPWQVAPRPEGPFYIEKMATQYIEFDLDLANEHLDKAGYPDRDSSDFRLGPDGNRISFNLLTTSESSDTLELLRQYWLAVGIEMRVQTVDRSLFFERLPANDFDATVWGGDAGLYDAIFFPRWWFPSNFGGESSFYAVPWANWYDGREPSEEPPEQVKRQFTLFGQVQATVDDDERVELFRQLLEITTEEFYVIGVSLPDVGYGIVKNNFHNVPQPMMGSSPIPYPATGNPEQYFIEEA